MSLRMNRNRIINGNAVTILGKMPDNTVDLVVTSPPYDSLRSYHKNNQDKYNGYSFPFEAIAVELERVVKKGGVIVWVVADAVVKGSESGSSFRQALYFMQLGFRLHDTMIYEKNGVSFPARRDGNRYTQIFDFMFVFSNQDKPKTANLIIDKKNRWAGWQYFGSVGSRRSQDGELVNRSHHTVAEVSARNNIWRINTGSGYSSSNPIAFEHPAIFPEELVEGHIQTWSEPSDLVIDCFSGSGTVPVVCKRLDRRYIGIDISKKYCEIARRRLDDE